MKLDRTVPPVIRPLGEFEIARPERMEMKNGIPLNIIHAGSQEVVRLDILVWGGQCQQEQPLQAMFTNRMLREGTSSFTSQEIAEKLDYYGAWLELSSSLNCGFITLYSLNKYFPKVLEIISDMLMHPLFPEKELDIVREVNKQQFLVNSTRVEVISRKLFNRSLFGEQHPLGRYAEEEDYARITTGVLKKFYRDYYHSSNCSVYVSGKVTPEIIRCIEENIGNDVWGYTREMIRQQLPEPSPTTEKRHFVERADALQSSLKMGDFVMDSLHPDFLKCRVMTTLFGGYFGSRLMSNIREDKGYTYGIGAGIINYPGRSILAISTEADNQYVDAIVREVYHEMDRLCNELPEQEELDMVKSYMLGDLSRSYEGPFSLSDAWIFVETAGVDPDFFVRSIRTIREMTAEDIRIMAQRYLRKESLIEVVAGKKV